MLLADAIVPLLVNAELWEVRRDEIVLVGAQGGDKGLLHTAC